MTKYPSSSSLLLLFLVCVSGVAETNGHGTGHGTYNGICNSLVKNQGYPCAEHQVTTEDGYILGLQRIPHGRSGNNKLRNKKVSVLLQHGILTDAAAWLLNPPDQSLAFILADKGFDVWLANTRGTNSSQRHTSLSTNNPAYWEWTWEQLAAYELPAVISYVQNQTGQKSHYVGHSLGTLTALAALPVHNLINSLRSAALLSPVTYLSQISTLIIRVANQTFVAENFYNSGLRDFPLLGALLQTLKTTLCEHPGVNCSNILAAVTVIRTGTIRKFDYNFLANLWHYHKYTPPVYNMANIPKGIPLFFTYGGRDAISDVNDVKALLNDLKNHDEDKLVEQYVEEYAQLDFVMGSNVSQRVSYAHFLRATLRVMNPKICSL